MEVVVEDREVAREVVMEEVGTRVTEVRMLLQDVAEAGTGIWDLRMSLMEVMMTRIKSMLHQVVFKGNRTRRRTI